MNIKIRACVQNVHQQHAHMISDGHAMRHGWCSGQSQNKFASSIYTGRRCHESLFHTRIAVWHPK